MTVKCLRCIPKNKFFKKLQHNVLLKIVYIYIYFYTHIIIDNVQVLNIFLRIKNKLSVSIIEVYAIFSAATHHKTKEITTFE